ncbi:MAG: hypothetical protein KDH96_01625 [Candidatus Riesia sp.]|nr:hypothetical protein [Candidatus Riesia sp.]
MIYTGYYGRDGRKPNCVGISAYVPNYLPNIIHVPILAPTLSLVYQINNNRITEDEYKQFFLQLLSDRKIPWDQIAKELDEKILCCFEKEGFCHRHLVAEQFRLRGFQVEEITDLNLSNEYLFFGD